MPIQRRAKRRGRSVSLEVGNRPTPTQNGETVGFQRIRGELRILSQAVGKMSEQLNRIENAMFPGENKLQKSEIESEIEEIEEIETVVPDLDLPTPDDEPAS